MGLETGSYINDLVPTNPLSSDLQSQGDDHLRLIKNVLKNTIPNGDRAQYFARALAKTADYSVAATDMSKVITVDATGGAVAITLPPALTVSDDGWSCEVVKIDSSANLVTVVGTINGETNIVISAIYEAVRFLWTGTAWLALHPITFSNGTMVMPVGTTATRPASPLKGAFWYNNTTAAPEFSDGTSWFPLLFALSGAQMSYGMVINGTLVESHAANAVTFAVKTLAGNDPSPSDPVLVAFRQPTGVGSYLFKKITAALSLTISSGSTMGVPANNQPFNLWFALFWDGTNVQLAAMNTLSGVSIYNFGRDGFDVATAEGGVGGADSAQTFYSASAIASPCPYVPFAYALYNSGLASIGAWASTPTRLQLYGPGIPLPGERVQLRRTNFGTFVQNSPSTAIPGDNTIPQITEGDQYMTQTITPRLASNLLRIRSQGMFTYGAGTANFSMALFRDATANAIAVTSQGIPSGNQQIMPYLEAIQLASSIASTTYRIRAGGLSTSAAYFNGSAGAQFFGGVAASFLEIEELQT